jgi:hypothetical protein
MKGIEFQDFCEEYAEANKGVLNDSKLITALQEKFTVKEETAYYMWFCANKEWYSPEMMGEIIRLTENPKDGEFVPVWILGNFKWDKKNKKFTP